MTTDIKTHGGQQNFTCQSTSLPLALFDAIILANDLISQIAEPAGHGPPPPPSYRDVLDDLPPDYSTLPVLAKAKPSIRESAPPPAYSKKPPKHNSKPNPAPSIDFESTHGFRQHGKKQKAKLAAKRGATGGGGGGGGGNEQKKDDETVDAPGGSGGAGGDEGGSNGGNDGDGDKNDDDWGDWTTSSSKKKSKKKQEEEEEERKKKEEEEAAAAGSAANNLSWADDFDAGNEDNTWAGFTSVGKKDKKKKSSVRRLPLCLGRVYAD